MEGQTYRICEAVDKGGVRSLFTRTTLRGRSRRFIARRSSAQPVICWRLIQALDDRPDPGFDRRGALTRDRRSAVIANDLPSIDGRGTPVAPSDRAAMTHHRSILILAVLQAAPGSARQHAVQSQGAFLQGRPSDLGGGGDEV